jgi:hypothetical protein
MQWNSKSTKTLPSVGQKRTVKRFAWYPIIMSDSTYIWLTFYTAEQQYQKLEEYHITHGTEQNIYIRLDWADISRTVIKK